MILTDEQRAFSSKMTFWWLLSVPYSTVFLLMILALALVGISPATLGHSGVIVPFLVLAVATSISSGAWLIAASCRIMADRAKMRTKGYVMLGLSAIPAIWCAIYLLRG